MSERRRHLLVLLIVLGLIAGSAVAVLTQSTKLGLDLQGGVQLVYQGKATKQTAVNAESLQRALDIMRDRVDAFGVVRARARAHRRGPDRGQPPGRRGRRARRPPGRLDRPALLLRLGEERPRRELQDQRHRDQRRPAARHRSLQRGQARRRSATSRCRRTARPRPASRFYAFDKVSKKPFNQRHSGRVARRGARRAHRRRRRRRPRSSRSSRACSSCATRSRPPTRPTPTRSGSSATTRASPAPTSRTRSRTSTTRPAATSRTSPSTSPTRAARRSRTSPPRSPSAAPTTPTRSTRTRSRTRSTSRSRSTTSSSRSR